MSQGHSVTKSDDVGRLSFLAGLKALTLNFEDQILNLLYPRENWFDYCKMKNNQWLNARP